MKKSRLLGAVCAFLFSLITVSANAALISSATVSVSYGDLQGLEWLSLDVTAGRSRTDVESDTALNADGWRYATRQETETLVNSVSSSGISGTSHVHYAGARWFLDNFGVLNIVNDDFYVGLNSSAFFFGEYGECSADHNQSCYGSLATFENYGRNVFSPVWNGTYWAYDQTYRAGHGHAGVVTDQGGANMGLTSENYVTSIDHVSSTFGSLLVREASVVPIPASVWLFGSGLLGLVGIARRRKVVKPSKASKPSGQSLPHSTGQPSSGRRLDG